MHVYGCLKIWYNIYILQLTEPKGAIHMNGYKHTLCLLTALLAVGTLLACGDNTTDDTTKTTDASTAPTTEAVSPYADDLPEGLDYNGYEFRVLTGTGYNTTDSSWKGYIEIDAENGDILNDAAYRRNLEVEERLNVDIKCIENGGQNDTLSILEKSVLADSDDYDYAFPHPSSHGLRSLPSLMISGVLYDISALPYVSLDQPYYSSSIRDEVTVKDKLYMIAGDYSCTMYSSTYIWFNKDLWNEYSLEDPYDIVRSGKWTLDKCVSLIKGTYRDLNANNKRDTDDFYGIAGLPETATYAFVSGEGKMFSHTNDGFEFTVTTDRNISLLEDLVALMDNPDACFGYADSLQYREPFFNGKAIMLFSGSSIVLLRDSTFTAGLLPFPKYDEAQENYISLAAGGLTYVPATICDPERTGAIIEALFSASSRGFKDAFYQQYVNNKVLQDEGSLEMFKLIYANSVYDFTSVIDPSGSVGNQAIISKLLSQRSTDLVSRWAKYQKSVESAFTEFFEELQ